MNTLASINDCCDPDCPTSGPAIPGPAGSDGANGEPGSDGVNAYTLLSASFVQPAASGNVLINVVDGSWMQVGQNVFVENGGYYEVVSKTSKTQITIQNLDYPSNAAPAASVANGGGISPAGLEGVPGQNGSPADVPLTTKGDLLTRDATTNVRLAVGANGTRPVADSTQAAGLKYDKVNLNLPAEVAGALGIANGGTGQITANPAFNALSPVTTRGDLIYRNATVNARLALGASGTVAQSNGTDPVYALIGVANLDTTMVRTPVSPALYREEQASGTVGGTFTSGAWQTRLLNVETYDPGGIGSLAANQVTLGAGTYRFKAWAVGYECDSHQTRLFNVTAATTIAFGSVARSGAAVEVQVASMIEGRFTLVGATVIELQHRCETTKATTGFGKAAGFGNLECYSCIEFVREAQ